MKRRPCGLHVATKVNEQTRNQDAGCRWRLGTWPQGRSLSEQLGVARDGEEPEKGPVRMGSARTQVTAVHEQPTQGTSRDEYAGGRWRSLSTEKPLELLPRLHDSGCRGAPGWGRGPRDSNKQGPGQDQGVTG